MKEETTTIEATKSLLEKYIQEQLSVKDFDALHDTMNITKKKLTMIIRNPLIMDMSEVFNLSAVLKMSWKKFIEEFIEPLR